MPTVRVGNKKRHSVVDLKDNHPEKFGRFIMALKNLINSSDWGRICGIHGNTFDKNDKEVKCPTDPDVVTKIGETGEPFYCKHAVYSFIGWHTPYVYQFELLLNKHNKSSNTDYITLPWLDLTDTSVDFTFMNDPEITIFYDKKRFTTENPLAGAYYYVDGQRVRTTRGGFLTPQTKKQKKQINTVKKQLNNALYATNYERFSSAPTKKAADNVVLDYVPLETPHNSLHDIIGGDSGNMSQVNIAAFDPIFWLHHCNMDRHYYTWVHSVTDGFKKSLYPDLITDGTYNNTCPPFFDQYVYSSDWINYKWGWTNGSGKYANLRDFLEINKYPFTYDIIKPAPYIEIKAFVELIDIPIPNESLELNLYVRKQADVLNRDLHFAGSAVWFGVNRANINCCRCNVALTNIKIDIEEYVRENGITATNMGDWTFILEGNGRLIKDADGKYSVYNMADLLKGGTFKVVIN
jgi:hypothetical protein